MEGDVWGWAEVGGGTLLPYFFSTYDILFEASHSGQPTMQVWTFDKALQTFGFVRDFGQVKTGFSGTPLTTGYEYFPGSWGLNKSRILIRRIPNFVATPGDGENCLIGLDTTDPDPANWDVIDATAFDVTNHGWVGQVSQHRYAPPGDKYAFLVGTVDSAPRFIEVDISTLTIARTIAYADLESGSGSIVEYAYSADERFLALLTSGTTGTNVSVLERGGYTRVAHIVPGFSVSALFMSEDGSYLNYSSGSNTYVWRSSDWTLDLIISPNEAGLLPMMLSPDNRYWFAPGFTDVGLSGDSYPGTFFDFDGLWLGRSRAVISSGVENADWTDDSMFLMSIGVAENDVGVFNSIHVDDWIGAGHEAQTIRFPRYRPWR